jgi:hypothetical protein
MSGMKINYHKSDVFVLGVEDIVREEIAAKLNWEKQDLHVVNGKMIKRTDPWQGRMMSSGGRLILVNSCLSNIPNYVMGFYNITDGQHRQLDSIRGRFFWQGDSKIFKYHMAKWEDLAVPMEGINKEKEV